MKRAISGVALMAAALALLPAAGNAATIDVTTNADKVGVGLSCSLREAVQAAAFDNADTGGAGVGCTTGVEVTGPYGTAGASDTILLDAATYNLDEPGALEELNVGGDIDVTGSSDPVTIRGSGQGMLDTRVESALAGERIFDLQTTLELTLEDMTVRSGDTLTMGTSAGGNIRTIAGSGLVLNRVTVADGVSSNGAGASIAGTFSINDSLFQNNAQASGGGAIITGAASSGSITRTRFFNNDSFNGFPNGQPNGGAITHGGGMLDINDSEFVQNEATSTDVNDDGAFARGGAISSSGAGPLTIRRSLFLQNMAATSGATEEETGGAVRVVTTPTTILNSTFYGNTVGGGIGSTGQGGAIYAQASNVTVRHSTFEANVSTGAGQDGDHLFSGPGTLLTTSGSILPASAGDICGAIGSIDSGGFNVADPDPECEFVMSDSTAGGPIGLEPGAPQDNGGPTDTIALVAGSRALDFLSAGACATAEGTDQRLLSRPQGSACDAGAYEVCTTPGGSMPECPPPLPVVPTPIATTPATVVTTPVTTTRKKCKKGRKLRKGKCRKKRKKKK